MNTSSPSQRVLPVERDYKTERLVGVRDVSAYFLQTTCDPMLQFPTPAPPRTDSLPEGSIITSPSELINNVVKDVEDAQRVLKSEASDEQQLKQVLGRMISRVQELVSLQFIYVVLKYPPLCVMMTVQSISSGFQNSIRAGDSTYPSQVQSAAIPLQHRNARGSS
jgi:hypothetical protein